MDISSQDKARILTEALPYIRDFFGKTIVIKYGGAAMTDPALKRQFAEDVVLMKYVGMSPIVVHGGGPQISEMMKKLGKEPQFVNGIRVTDADTMEIAEMVLSGRINKEIVTQIDQHGGKAVGLTGKDGALIRARPAEGDGGDMGHVGEVARINPLVLTVLAKELFIPVISPVGADHEGRSYNINADFAASAIAVALSAEKFIMLTDVQGILNTRKELYSSLSSVYERRHTKPGTAPETLPRGVEAFNRMAASQERQHNIRRLIEDGTISGGMLPKAKAALSAIEGGVRKVHIIDGRVPHALLLEIFTNTGVGTEIRREPEE